MMALRFIFKSLAIYFFDRGDIMFDDVKLTHMVEASG
jgi:hypothetical protein